MFNYNSCATHCCVKHGCKYGYEGCPVVRGVELQEYECETCSWAVQELVDEHMVSLDDIVDGWKLATGDLCLHVRISPLATREVYVKLPGGTKNA